MPSTVYEFPLNEKVRTYLRLEQSFTQLWQSAKFTQDWQAVGFLESLFTLVELLDRVDIRTDLLKDFEEQERILQHWARHPDIDAAALQDTIQRTFALRDALRKERKFGAVLREDRFLNSIKQRFSIPGATCSFDLPSLHFWLKQPSQSITADVERWLKSYALLRECLTTNLGFLRDRGQFESIEAAGGFYQGVADDKVALIRIRCATDMGYYPTLSGNKYRYAVRFMLFSPDDKGSSAVTSAVPFAMARC